MNLALSFFLKNPARTGTGCLFAGLLLFSTGINPDISHSETPGDFILETIVKSPSPEEIIANLKVARESFRDLFLVEPPTVKIILQDSSEGAPPSSGDRAEKTEPSMGKGPPQYIISWTIKEGESLSAQTFSDLAHEITHIYLMDYMEEPAGHHQTNAWLHEAVSIRAELDPFRKNREKWIREHIKDRIPLYTFFIMKNPQKENPLVLLIAELNEKLHRGEIRVEEMHHRVSEYTLTHSEEMSRAGIRNMTYYSQSYSVFEFLLKSRGSEFIRSAVNRLKKGDSMEAIIKEIPDFSGGLTVLEDKWVDWVMKGN